MSLNLVPLFPKLNFHFRMIFFLYLIEGAQVKNGVLNKYILLNENQI